MTSTTPALSPTADSNPYVPVSWMAVTSLLVAVLYLLLLLFFGYSAAFKDGRPLVMPQLLILAVLGVILSFAGRRMIRNSEGTRTGETLTATAWWICIVGGLGYFAYLAGIEYTVKSDAKVEVERWVDNVVKGDFSPAFYATIDAPLRTKINSKDFETLKERFRDRYVTFEQTDLVRLARRNPDACKFEGGALREWTTRSERVECVYTGLMKCPEGKFPVEIPLRGTESVPGTDASVRQWEIMALPRGFIKTQEISLTPYGWRLSELERDGDELGRTFIAVVHDGPHMIPWAYATMMNPDAYLDFWKGVRLLAMYPLWGELPRGLVPIINEVPKIALMSLSISPKYVGYRWESFFRLPGGLPASADQEKTFVAVWKAAGILPSGQAKGGLLPNNDTIDPHASIAVKDNAVEVRVPCEMSALAPGGGFAYRARVVLSCTEPDVIAELKRLRASADPDSGTVPQPADFRKRHFKWQVVGIESDLARVSTSKMEQMAMEGAPPPGGK